MTGPTRPAQPLSINAILVIAALCASASVLVVPKATLAPPSAASAVVVETDQASATTYDEARVHRDLMANLSAIGQEASVVFGAVGTATDAAVN